MSVQDKKTYILNELKRHGCRITSQRKLLIDIILEDECSSCKEIYYRALKEEPEIGMATVYRMMRTLEDTGLIRRKNLYQIQYDEKSA